MFREMQDQMQRRADLLLSGRFEDMSRQYIYPLPVYLDTRMVAVRDASDGIGCAAALRAALCRRQIRSLTITVRAIEIPRGGRFRVWADWHAVSDKCARSRLLGLTCYMRETGQGFLPEMLHYQTNGRIGPASSIGMAQRA